MKISQRILVTVVTSSVRIRQFFCQEGSYGVAILLVPLLLVVYFLMTAASNNRRGASRNRSSDASAVTGTGTGTSTSIYLLLLPILAAYLYGRTHTKSLLHAQPPDLNYYEDKSFEPRQIEPLYYKGGTWRTIVGNKLIKFHGINLPAKTPSNPSHLKSTSNITDFYASKETVSFVGRPFPKSSADEHFDRISKYGFNLIRLSVTWEAVMHQGPGIIDIEFIDYIKDIVKIAAKYGLYVIIDPHQDVWSRFTGGDGAPAWTLEAAGFKVGDGSLHAAGCAFLHQHLEDEPPTMAWPTNYGRLATATMFTLFFAGDEYAPGITVPNTEGETIQRYLRRHYAAFISAIAAALREEANVLGFETMNEPSNGFVGIDDLRDLVMPAPFLAAVSGFESMRLGSGESFEIEHYSAPFVFDSIVKMNADEQSCWTDPSLDIWRRVGVYDIEESTGQRRLQRPHYFRRDNDDFLESHLLPFFVEIEQAVSSQNKRFVTYAAPHIDVMNPSTPHAPAGLSSDRYGWAPHWYDAATLLLKSYSSWFALDVDSKLPVFSPSLIDKAFQRNLYSVKDTGKRSGGKASLHVIVGETGIPFDLNGSGDKFQADQSNHETTSAALDRTLRAMEANDLEYVLWNYYHENTEAEGDHWNGEDLSIRSDGDNRGLLAAVRPYIYSRSSHGHVVEQYFDPYTGHYRLKVKTEGVDVHGGTDDDSAAPGSPEATFEIFLPSYHFRHNPSFISTSGKVEPNRSRQTVLWRVVGCQCELVITGRYT